MVNPTHFALFSQLSAQARAANTLAELTFSVVNDSYALLPFRQAQAWREDAGGGELLAVSGLANPAEDSPYLFWLRRLWPWLRKAYGRWEEPLRPHWTATRAARRAWKPVANF